VDRWDQKFNCQKESMQEGIGDNNWSTHPRVYDYPPRPPFPQQITQITKPNQKQQPLHVKHPRGLHQQPPPNEGLLQWGNKGINMNQIAYQKPTHIYQGDSCLAGLGGFSHKGFAWRYYLPPKL
jgi:hypothetical protein